MTTDGHNKETHLLEECVWKRWRNICCGRPAREDNKGSTVGGHSCDDCEGDGDERHQGGLGSEMEWCGGRDEIEIGKTAQIG